MNDTHVLRDMGLQLDDKENYIVPPTSTVRKQLTWIGTRVKKKLYHLEKSAIGGHVKR